MTFLVPPTSAIMLGIPGASTAVATTFDGRPLAMKGQADKALGCGCDGVFRWRHHFDYSVHHFGANHFWVVRGWRVGSHGDISIFFSRPISGTIMVIAILLLALPLFKIIRDRMKASQGGAV